MFKLKESPGRIQSLEKEVEHLKRTISKLNNEFFGRRAFVEVDSWNCTTINHPQILGTKPEVEKLKAIVAELCDYVYADKAELDKK